MGMENVLGAPQQVENIYAPENTGEMLNRRVYAMQLEYADRLKKGLTPFPDDRKPENLKLGEILVSFTNIGNEIANRFSARTGKESSREDEEYISFKDRIYTGIRDAYVSDSSSWTSKVEGIVQEALASLPKGEWKHPEGLNEHKKTTAGIIHYHTYSFQNYGDYYKDDAFFRKELLQNGVALEDDCMSIHIDPLAMQKDTKDGIKTSFSKLAEAIVTEKQSIRAILARSWLLDTPLAEPLGFHVDAEHAPAGGGLGMWYQFLDKDGNIKEEEKKRFFETGRPRFYEREGYMLTEEFLKKYLPEEKRGEIQLKKFNPEFTTLLEAEKHYTNVIIAEWDLASIESIERMVDQTKILSRFFNETEEGKKTWAFFLDQKSKGVSYSEMINSPESAGYSAEYKKFTDSLSHIEYTVKV